MGKVFTIFGATGQQGGALIRYLLQSPIFRDTYHIRGVTRDASKAGAHALRQQGVEVVEADMNEADSLRLAVRDSYVVFAMTSYWETAQPPVEITQGKAIADAAVAEKVQVLIWSSLPPIGIPHFDSKAEVERYIRTLPITSAFFMPGWYMQNFLTVTKPRRLTDTKHVLAPIWPSATAATLVPLINIEDTGKYLAPVLQDPQKYHHMNLSAATGFYSLGRICEIWTECTGTQVVFDGGDSEGPGSDGFGYFGAEGQQGLEWTLAQIKEELTSWEDFVKAHEPWFS